MDVIFGNPSREDLFNWSWEDNGQPVYSAHVGAVPIGSGTEPIENADGTWGTHSYLEYAHCTVYVSSTAFLVIEFYEGSASGNPEDGERVTYYVLQCQGITEARAIAVELLGSANRVFDAGYFDLHGFTKEVA